MSNGRTNLQASVVPFRRTEERIEFCLITTRRSKRWGFPKGTICPHETVDQTALSEADEEAGLTGRIVGEPLGEYAYTKEGRELLVTVLLMEVDGCRDKWRESNQRDRRWASADEARRLLDRQNLVQLLLDALEQIQGGPDELPDDAALSA